MSGEIRAFREAVDGLRDGDFSRLAFLFDGEGPIVEWFRAGRFADEPEALAEAFSCACFNGRIEVAEYLLDRGVDPLAGSGTGLNAFHWAVDRGQLEATLLLIRRGVPLEVRNMYGGTVLGAAVWSAINAPRADHLAIIDALIRAGADLDAVAYPTGNSPIDELLRRHGRGA